MRSIAIAIIALLFGVSGSSATMPQPSCSTATAQPVALTELLGNLSRFVGECVTVEGPSNGAMMYSGIDGYYLAGPLIGGADDDGPLEGRVLGFQPIQSAGWPHLWQVRATGIVGVCRQLREGMQASAGPNAIIMMGGYCHSSDGPILTNATREHIRPLAFERKIGEEQRRRFGDLAIADASWAHHEAASALAAQFLDAIHRNDTAAILRLHGLEEESWPDEIADTLAAVFGTRSAFSRIERSSDSRLAILIRSGAANEIEGGRTDEFEALLCFCLDDDCRDRLPISRMDADNAFNRPYACTTIETGQWASGERFEQFTTVLTPYATLFEPIASDQAP